MQGETVTAKAVSLSPVSAGEAATAGPLVLASLGAVALLILSAWVWWQRRERAAGDPAGAAFACLARRTKLSKVEREHVRELAAYVPGATPVALLVSQSAMASAMTAAEA